MVETKKRANGFKLILALLSVLIIAVVALPLAACGSGDDEEDVPLGPIPEGSLRLTVNYLRPKADYTDWEMWLWAPTGAGGDYNPPYHFKTRR